MLWQNEQPTVTYIHIPFAVLFEILAFDIPIPNTKTNQQQLMCVSFMRGMGPDRGVLSVVSQLFMMWHVDIEKDLGWFLERLTDRLESDDINTIL